MKPILQIVFLILITACSTQKPNIKKLFEADCSFSEMAEKKGYNFTTGNLRFHLEKK